MTIGFIAYLWASGLWKRLGFGRKFHKKLKRSPLRDNMLRHAGLSLRLRIDDIREELSDRLWWLIIIPAVSSTILFVQTNPQVFYWYTTTYFALYGLFLFFIIRKIPRLFKELRELRIGLDGELAVGEELNQLMRFGYYVYHDFPAKGFNIDHIVIGPSGVYSVETKARSKLNVKGHAAAKITVKDEILYFPNYTDKKSIQQAINQAKWLERFLNKSIDKPIAVRPVLALPGWFIERKSYDGGIMVINPRNASKIFENQPAKLDGQTIQQVSYQVEQQCRTVEPYDPL
jgi:hypothetical protein